MVRPKSSFSRVQVRARTASGSLKFTLRNKDAPLISQIKKTCSNKSQTHDGEQKLLLLNLSSSLM